MNIPPHQFRFHQAENWHGHYNNVLHRFMESLNVDAIPNIVNNFPNLSRFQKDMITFQATIMFSGYDDIRNFIVNYNNLYGQMTTYLFINSPIYDPESQIAFTPLICACLWKTNTDVVRLLYSYGANVNLYDNFGLYPEHHYNVAYLNHLSRYICHDNVENPRYAGGEIRFRNMNEFVFVRDEVELLAGVRFDNDWQRPELVVDVNNFH